MVSCYCEPQLSKRGLYNLISHKHSQLNTRLLINIITYCDGTNTAAEIADIVGTSVAACCQTNINVPEAIE